MTNRLPPRGLRIAESALRTPVLQVLVLMLPALALQVLALPALPALALRALESQAPGLQAPPVPQTAAASLPPRAERPPDRLPLAVFRPP